YYTYLCRTRWFRATAMAQNPLFNQNQDADDKPDDGYVLPNKQGRIEPPASDIPNGPANPAVELIRQKVANLYVTEPDTKEELNEAEEITPRSKHQQFMYELSTSGKGLAEIQTAWH